MREAVAGKTEAGVCRACGKPTPRLRKVSGFAMYCSAACRSGARSQRQSKLSLGKLRAPVPPQPQDKRCATCKRRKVVGEFGQNRSTLDGLDVRCKSCKRRKATESRERHREALRLRQQEWRKSNPELSRQLDRARYAENKAGRRSDSRARKLQEKYGLTLEQFDQMAKAQGYACAICGTHPEASSERNRGTLNVDHDHATGKVRGLLCISCNLGIGHFGEDSDKLRKAMAYLDTQRGETGEPIRGQDEKRPCLCGSSDFQGQPRR